MADRSRVYGRKIGLAALHFGLVLVLVGAICSRLTVRSERMFLHSGDSLPLFGHNIAYVSDSVIAVDGADLLLVPFKPQQADGWRFQLLMSRDGVVAVEMRSDPIGAPLVFAGYGLFVLGGILLLRLKALYLIAIANICGFFIKLVFPDRLLTAALQSSWFAVHVGLIAVAYALFLALPWMSTRRAGHYLLSAVWIFGCGIIAGSLWGHDAWGRYWGWDPKETGALMVWLTYCLPLHSRALRRHRLAYILPLLLLPLLLILPGLHSYL